MPVVTLDKADLYERLGKKYTRDEFDQLCFEFGIELEEDSDDEPPVTVDGVPERPTIKIDIPANRYDLLCLEGIALALNIFLEKETTPNYKIVQPPDGQKHVLTIDPETSQIRPYAAAAVLRGVKFDKRRYDSFIALQDKLHANLCRARSLVAIGTHDLSTIKGPFTYEAPKPADIKFVPLNQTKEMDGNELMQFYSEHRILSKFLPLIRDSPVYPVIYDADHTVCSLPPIINSNHSKITLDTRDIFIECTATDQTKLEIVLNIVVAMFSQYAEEPFTVEAVEIKSEHNGCSRTTPSIAARKHEAEISYINSCTGLDQSAETIVKQLARMSMNAKHLGGDKVEVSVPCTRADILHQCDIMEDVAIAYGYNNLAKTVPSTATVGQPLPINKLADIIRKETAMAGFTECMPLILCSREENFAWLRKTDDSMAVSLANPKTVEYQIARTSLLPGCLKTIRENRKHALPIRVFEVSDVVFKNMQLERRAHNQRNFCAVVASNTANFETIHGLLDRVMKMVSVKLVKKSSTESGYWIEEGDDATFFPGRNAYIMLRTKQDGEGERIGVFGALHPEVMQKFDLPLAASALELNVEKLL
ncbi:Phenylalanyl-tRNA synthetase, beta subunit [Taphrina deformans PYCC 5710]|uniref:phenylalanine--tRNA ligase n=1 Tax=Taphrina deformans (strain PYCC 5710 / ATCC 11124 / CBS 356.35 / IMI 108563 / JCM 9778 / NBRC 8474) TaxID=1097556 RepID=R4X9W2_TAPDE|nr:Phenylalanyl-tRNA synthetase, beta subunit [Taphrina deformans PYCC 5710]|eukprot:CCG82588.1 Phenylalanyl-tRNA synthetase, beta subunit [Taphrina deformans PYCC 5710]